MPRRMKAGNQPTRLVFDFSLADPEPRGLPEPLSIRPPRALWRAPVSRGRVCWPRASAPRLSLAVTEQHLEQHTGACRAGGRLGRRRRWRHGVWLPRPRTGCSFQPLLSHISQLRIPNWSVSRSSYAPAPAGSSQLGVSFGFARAGALSTKQAGYPKPLLGFRGQPCLGIPHKAPTAS
jgi:hypothetical protein